MRTYPIGKCSDVIRKLGRVYTEPDTGYLCIDWTLSGIEFRYTGRVLTAHFWAESGQEPSGAIIPENQTFWTVWPRFAVYLDDEKTPHRIFTLDKPDKDEIIFSSDKKEDHTIRILKLTEHLKTTAKIDSFFGDGEILKAKHAKKPGIEFVGDSVTCGFGNLGTMASIGFFSEEQDPMQAYAWAAAEELGMEYSMIGYSGICAGFKMWNRKPYSMLDLYAYTDRIREERDGHETFEEWDFKHHPQDYIVINLGTNDAEAVVFMEGDHEEYEKQYEQYYYDLLVKVREKNGLHPKIICALGDMRYYLLDNMLRAVEKFRADTGDTKIYTLKLVRASAAEPRGAVDHPSAHSGRKMGRQLAAFIRSIG